MSKEIYFVTGNDKKFNEISANLSADVKLIQHDLDTLEIQTTSLLEISKDKALKAFEEIKKPLIVDDSGVFFDHYFEFPGAMAKHMFKSLWFEGFERLLAEERIGKKWSMQTVISYMDETLKEPLQFIWKVEGEFNFDFLEEFGDDKFMPYNHIFVPDWYEKPVQFFYDEFKMINQRARATKKLNEFLRK